jgi:hypothetical protein
VDWVQVWWYANQIMSGFTYAQLLDEGFILNQEDEKCFAEAFTDPAKYAKQAPDAEAGGCYLSDEFVTMIIEKVANLRNTQTQ